ncbi:MAG: long-subunit fatty acid transport protein [Paraglaciecola sp.]|jgi:long-subunit fatty acid transport protein
MISKLFYTSLIFTLALLSNPLLAQQNEFGNWLMYFGTNRISDDWSIHSEIQYRNHTVQPTNIEQLLLRTGVNYHLNDNAIVTFGYGYIASYDFESEQKAPESTEHRLFQQLILINKLGRIKFEHRYRLEQRWVNSDYRNRLRYRLMVFIPINKPTITKGTLFLAIYDEIFMNTEQTFFDRNRLYGALGYQFSKMVQVQVGYLYQRVNAFGKSYLQFGVVVNPDFRE